MVVSTMDEPNVEKKKRHRPRATIGKPSPTHKPTPELRTKVSNWAEVGTSHEVIAQELGIHTSTLTKYYREELDDAPRRSVAKVANALYEKALKGDTVSMIFYLKSRGKWRDWDPKGDKDNPIVVKVDTSPLDAALELVANAARAKPPAE